MTCELMLTEIKTSLFFKILNSLFNIIFLKNKYGQIRR